MTTKNITLYITPSYLYELNEGTHMVGADPIHVLCLSRVKTAIYDCPVEIKIEMPENEGFLR